LKYHASISFLPNIMSKYSIPQTPTATPVKTSLNNLTWSTICTSAQNRLSLRKVYRHRPLPVSDDVENAPLFRRTENVLEFLIGEDSIAAIRDEAKKDGDEGEEVCEGVWNEETAGVISIAIYRVPSSDFGSSIVPGGRLPSFYG
jgi:hypothetical protein